MFQISLEFDAFHGHAAGEQHVHELAVGGARAQLLDLREAGLQAVVHPRQHVMSREVL